jgi:hypothetical protein
MAYVADRLVIFACTELTKTGERNSIQPFIEYLESGKPITENIRRWLIDLMKDRSQTGHSLEYKMPEGRRTSIEEFEKKRSIYERAAELRAVIVTQELVDELLDRTGMELAPPDRSDATIYRLGWRAADPYFVDPVITLRLGQKLNQDQIHKIIVAESEADSPSKQWVSLSTVKRALKEWTEALSTD